MSVVHPFDRGHRYQFYGIYGAAADVLASNFAKMAVA